jgi:hypothetical protein
MLHPANHHGSVEIVDHGSDARASAGWGKTSVGTNHKTRGEFPGCVSILKMHDRSIRIPTDGRDRAV